MAAPVASSASVAAGSRRLNGKVAIVTGGTQGIVSPSLAAPSPSPSPLASPSEISLSFKL
jgi:hypothetical protein